jgi:RNase P subunit RPR2
LLSNVYSLNSQEERDEVQAYCLKCRKKVEVQNATQVKLKNGEPAIRGKCEKCGTKVFRIGKG